MFHWECRRVDQLNQWTWNRKKGCHNFCSLTFHSWVRVIQSNTKYLRWFSSLRPAMYIQRERISVSILENILLAWDMGGWCFMYHFLYHNFHQWNHWKINHFFRWCNPAMFAFSYRTRGFLMIFPWPKLGDMIRWHPCCVSGKETWMILGLPIHFRTPPKKNR